jgi:hypothetical protein
MKYIKIILAVAVVGVIGFFIWYWSVTIGKVTPPSPPVNLHTKNIQSQIDSLKNMPSDVFCQKFYKDIEGDIKEFFDEGHLGNSKEENKQWKDILSKNLYSAYASKFADQAMYVFNGTEWDSNDLIFIRSEVNKLKSSSYLKNGSIAVSFNSIIDILGKYEEISGFITSCNNFYYPDNDISANYPDQSDKIQKSKDYLSNNLDNNYVNNCSRLRVDLNGIPNILFSKHVMYLKNKINVYGVRYFDFDKQTYFLKDIYNPLKAQLDDLKNDVYNIDNSYFSSEYSILSSKLSTYNTNAYYYFKNK